MNINHEVFQLEGKDQHEREQIFYAKCGLGSEFAEMAFDRTDEGEKYTQAGIDNTNKRIVEFGYSDQKRFVIGEDQSNINPTTPNIQVLCFNNDKQIVICFRGTHNIDGWIQNFKFEKVLTKIGYVHQGWHSDICSVYDDLWNYIESIPNYRNKKLIIVGHSKGAAESQIFTPLINERLRVDFNLAIGCPKAFSDETAARVSYEFNGYQAKQELLFDWRMVWVRNNNDIVTRIPLELQNAEQGGKMIYIGAGTFDTPGKVYTSINPISMWWDGVITGRIFKRTKIEKYDSAEDHHPCYYINSFYKACGSDRRRPRWLEKYM